MPVEIKPILPGYPLLNNKERTFKNEHVIINDLEVLK